MHCNLWLSFAAAAVTSAVAVIALWRDPRSFVHRVFAAGMALFALEAGLSAFAYMETEVTPFLFWRRHELIVASFIPSVWLLFSVTFARSNYREQVRKWKWVLIPSSVLLLIPTVFLWEAFFAWPPYVTEKSILFLQVEWAGYGWHLLSVTLAVLILMNLERTFRHSTGHVRWQTKFMFLGIGALFVTMLFTRSQVVLFKGVDTGLDIMGSGALLIANVLVLRALFRGKPLNVSIRLSHAFLYSSFTVLIVGMYFTTVGLLTWLSIRFEWIQNIHILLFMVFLTMIAMAVLLLSDRIRLMRKRFITRHLQRPLYDYRKIWEGFTARTATVSRTEELCHIIVRMVSETLEILSVTIWLADETRERLDFGGSTVFTAEQVRKVKPFSQDGAILIRAMSDQTMPLDLEAQQDDWATELRQSGAPEETRESRIRYCVPLNAADRLIGIMTLSEKVFYEPLSFEESELVKTMADQSAAALLNLRLSKRLRQAQELEAFQSMSAFFMHDLKNLASKLSLVIQNLPTHLDNPEFRADAFKAINQSVARINAMSSRLSMLTQKTDPLFNRTDLNELVGTTVSEMQGYARAPILFRPGEVPLLPIDRNMMHKVLENLIMNAADALTIDGNGATPCNGFTRNERSTPNPDPPSIRIATSRRNGWAEISIEDNGCGMTREYIENNIFRPFRTTKKSGMGIGLYHCKTIVEAHGGRIEVESEEGRGTMFIILLPLEQGQP